MAAYPERPRFDSSSVHVAVVVVIVAPDKLFSEHSTSVLPRHSLLTDAPYSFIADSVKSWH
jgi:hypothetical protein